MDKSVVWQQSKKKTKKKTEKINLYSQGSNDIKQFDGMSGVILMPCLASF